MKSTLKYWWKKFETAASALEYSPTEDLARNVIRLDNEIAYLRGILEGKQVEEKERATNVVAD